MRMSLLNEVEAKVAQFSLTGLEAVDRLVETTTPPEEAWTLQDLTTVILLLGEVDKEEEADPWMTQTTSQNSLEVVPTGTETTKTAGVAAIVRALALPTLPLAVEAPVAEEIKKIATSKEISEGDRTLVEGATTSKIERTIGGSMITNLSKMRIPKAYTLVGTTSSSVTRNLLARILVDLVSSVSSNLTLKTGAMVTIKMDVTLKSLSASSRTTNLFSSCTKI